MEKKARKAFLSECERWHHLMLSQLTGVADGQRAGYIFTLFSRFLFLYFVQCQGLLENNPRYLADKLEQCQAEGIAYHRFLIWLLQAMDPCVSASSTPNNPGPRSLSTALSRRTRARVGCSDP